MKTPEEVLQECLRLKRESFIQDCRNYERRIDRPVSMDHASIFKFVNEAVVPTNKPTELATFLSWTAPLWRTNRDPI